MNGPAGIGYAIDCMIGWEAGLSKFGARLG